MRKVILFVLSCLVASTGARAQSEETVLRLSGFRFESDAWTIQAIHNPDTGIVEALIAIAKPGATIGDNLNTVLFIRDVNTFEAWSWRNTTRARAVYSAKVILNVSDDDDALWQIDEELPWMEENPLRPPVPYDAGILTDDPLFEPVIGSEDPQALIDLLASLGYPVAALRLGDGVHAVLPDPDECEILLLSLATATEWALSQTIDSDESADAVSVGMSERAFSCAPPTCTPGPAGPFGAAVPSSKCVFSFRQRGGPVGANDYSCEYEMRKTFRESQTRPWTRSDCTIGTCTAVRVGYATGSARVCGTQSMTCPSQPSCGSPAASDPVCTSANAPDATGPGQWSEWSPTCE